MAVCSRCGSELNPNERYCGNCGLDTQAAIDPTVAQQTVPQQAAPQAVYVPPAAQTAGAGPGQRSDVVARIAMGLGIAGGLLGMLWGAAGPYISLQWPSYIGWFYGTNPYMTGIEPLWLLIIGLALGAVALVGASVATRLIVVTRVLLLICGLGGFLLGPSWLVPGALLLAGAGLAIAAKSGGS